MKKIFYVCCLMLLIIGCEDKEKKVIPTLTIEFEEPEYTYLIGVDAIDRDMLVDYLKEHEEIGSEFLLRITLEDRIINHKATYIIKTFDTLPHSPVYHKDNMWFIRYKYNKGYMPITR